MKYRAPARQFEKSGRAFTLLELLVVIAIIGLLAAIGLPSIRGFTKSNATIAGTRQVLDDVAYARQRAISDHTTVIMVFISPSVTGYVPPAGSDPSVLALYTNLLGGQYTTYAMLSLRQVGEQPGRNTPRYVSNWRTLPNGMFIAAAKFSGGTWAPFPTAIGIPYPVATNPPANVPMPYIAFNYLGQLADVLGGLRNVPYEDIPLAHGSIFYARGPDGNFVSGPADVQENPTGNSITTSNVIRIDALTGRAKLLKQEIQ